MRVKGIGLGGSKAKSEVALTARVIDATTGEILVSAKGLGESNKGGGVDFATGGFGVGHERRGVARTAGSATPRRRPATSSWPRSSPRRTVSSSAGPSAAVRLGLAAAARRALFLSGRVARAAPRTMAEPIFTVANQLTMLRMALVPAFVLLVLEREFSWALRRVRGRGLTDALDGFVARHANQSTRLGAMLDPVADKLLAGSAYVVLTWSSAVRCTIPVWLTVTLLFRDAMIVVGVVVVNLTVGPREFSPSRLGKLSTALIIATGAAVLAANATGDCPGALRWLFAATLAVLIGSTAHYVYQASERPPRRPGTGARRLACSGSRRASGGGPRRAGPWAPSPGSSAPG